MSEVYASNAKGNLGVTLGSVGLGAALLNGGLGNILGGGMNACSDNQAVSRYELGLQQQISTLTADKKLLEADRYTDTKILELYAYVDGKLQGVNASINQQAVVNAQVAANLSCMQQTISTLSGLTKTIIPISNVCPEPMPALNSWTAPTTTA